MFSGLINLFLLQTIVYLNQDLTDIFLNLKTPKNELFNLFLIKGEDKLII